MTNKGTINKTYERKMQSGHAKESKPRQSGATNNNKKEQVGTTNLAPHQDENIDIQLEAVTLEHCGSSLQLSTSQKYLAKINFRLPTRKEKSSIWQNPLPPLAPTQILSHKNPRMGDTSCTHSTKRRKGGRRQMNGNPTPQKQHGGLIKSDTLQSSNP